MYDNGSGIKMRIWGLDHRHPAMNDGRPSFPSVLERTLFAVIIGVSPVGRGFVIPCRGGSTGCTPCVPISGRGCTGQQNRVQRGNGPDEITIRGGRPNALMDTEFPLIRRLEPQPRRCMTDGSISRDREKRSTGREALAASNRRPPWRRSCTGQRGSLRSCIRPISRRRTKTIIGLPRHAPGRNRIPSSLAPTPHDGGTVHWSFNRSPNALSGDIPAACPMPGCRAAAW